MKDIETASGEHCILVIYAGILLQDLPSDHPLCPALTKLERARTATENAAALQGFAQAVAAPGLMQNMSQSSRDLISELLLLCPQAVQAA